MNDLKKNIFFKDHIHKDMEFNQVTFSSLAKEYKRVLQNTQSTQQDLVTNLTNDEYKVKLEERLRGDLAKKINAIEVSALPIEKLLQIGELLDDTVTENEEDVDFQTILMREEKMQIPLKSLQLSSRSYSFLYAVDLCTLGDIYYAYQTLGRDKFRKTIYKFGEKCLVEVETMLIQKGLLEQEDIKKTGG